MNVLAISIDSLRRDFLGAYRGTPRVIDYENLVEDEPGEADRLRSLLGRALNDLDAADVFADRLGVSNDV